MNDTYKLVITVPSADLPIIEYGRHFTVNGKIYHRQAVPADAVMTVKLLDAKGNVLRYATQTEKNSRSIYVDHPDLTAYDESIDPGRERLKDFGFAELMLKDTACPGASVNNATIKCWYSDDEFKSMIVSATSTQYGSILDDGIGFVDEQNNPYQALERGSYTIVAELRRSNGERLASTSKKIIIGSQKDLVICRINPLPHRQKMAKWSDDMGFFMSNDVLPGYLEPYTGQWFYHMGLLAMYRANDIALYVGPKIHMFVYLIDPTSTSYETELAFLQTKGCVGDPERFAAYHYDIGEAVLHKNTENERHGKILKFDNDEFLYLYRVDIVNEKAKENVFNLNEEAIITSYTDQENLTVRAGDDIAITGVVKPWQLDEKYFALRRDNIYDISNTVSTIQYVFCDGNEKKTFERKLLMQRIDGHPIGFSVYEFYNIFHLDEDMKGKTLTVEMTACDINGENPRAKKVFKMNVV